MANSLTSSNSKVPQHIAIIMDGNRRWAREKGVPSIVGHRKGAAIVKRIVEYSHSIGVRYLTVYAFSSENWNRPIYEVTGVMALLRTYLKKEVPHLHQNNVRMRFLGERTKLSPSIQKLMLEAEELTKNNTGLVFCPALNYGSWEEITLATRAIATKVQNGQLTPEMIQEETIADHLYTSGIPNPDLLIRTGGEKRLSNYLLLQLAYAEFIFTNIYWPDFNEEHLHKAIEEFNDRERRFGT